MLIPLDRGKSGKTATELKEFLRENIVGQDRAIKDLVNAMELYEAGFKDSVEPIYCVLLSGPSGVGKTLTAEVLAQFLFGGEKPFTKVACSDYTERHDISALIGSPPGYVGFFDPNDSKRGGAEPILSQRSIDKYAFLSKNKQSDDKAVAEATEKMEMLFDQKGVLVETLMELVERYNESLEQLVSQAQGVKDQTQAIDTRQKAWEVVNALLYSCRNLGLKKLNSGKSQKKLEKKLVELAKTANEAAQSSLAFIQNNNPVIQATLQRLMITEVLIGQQEKVLGGKGVAYNPADKYLSVVLFDEIEKANQALHNLLLEIMDKGTVTLKNGQVTSFANSIVVLTSNIGSEAVTKTLSGGGIGFQPERSAEGVSDDADQEIYNAVMRETKKVFPAYFLGRLDNIVVYRPLGRSDLKKILEMQLNRLQTRLAHSPSPILLKIEDAVKEFILDKSAKYAEQGVRVLNKRIQVYVTQELGRFQNSGQLKPGDIVHVQLKEVRGDMKVVLLREPRTEEATS
ncbi:MAG: AAA family ATPase [bacterium]|nr:AAA family ATPase [bacterium]